MAPWPTRVTSVPRRTTRDACSGSARSAVSTSPFSQYFAFGSRKITGSGERIASWIIQYASFGVDGDTTRRPGVCAKYASGLSWWCSIAPMCPPYGMRITTGRDAAPSSRFVSFASCVVIWSNAGKTNPSNWISTTGRKPASARPIAVPTRPDSASGLSITRCSPNSACSPSVTRKTPPSLPMSSPISTTWSSAAIAARMPAVSAFASAIDSVMPHLPRTRPRTP